MLQARIIQLCQQKNISINQLEMTLNLGKSSISRWDKASPRVESVVKIAEYFDVSVDYLLGKDDRVIRSTYCLPREILPENVVNAWEGELAFLKKFYSLPENERMAIKNLVQTISKRNR